MADDRMSALEFRIAELETKIRQVGGVSLTERLANFSAGSCTNTCTASCTIGCTKGCTGTCIAEAPGSLASQPASPTATRSAADYAEPFNKLAGGQR